MAKTIFYVCDTEKRSGNNITAIIRRHVLGSPITFKPCIYVYKAYQLINPLSRANSRAADSF